MSIPVPFPHPFSVPLFANVEDILKLMNLFESDDPSLYSHEGDQPYTDHNFFTAMTGLLIWPPNLRVRENFHDSLVVRPASRYVEGMPGAFDMTYANSDETR